MLEKKEGSKTLSKKLAIKVVFLAIVAIVFAVFAGCGEKDTKPEQGKKAAGGEQSSDAVSQSAKHTKNEPTKNKSTKKKSAKKKSAKLKPVIDMLPATSVVVRVNGEGITKGDFVVWEQAYAKMFAMSRGWKPGTVNDETKKFHKQNRIGVLQNLVKHTLVAQYAREMGIVATEKGVAAQERYFLRQMKKPKAKYADVIALFGEKEGEVVKSIVNGDALTKAVLVTTTSNDIYRVTALEFTNRVEFVKRVNMEADASNAVVRARAIQAKKEALAGTNFVDVAKKYADFAPEQGMEWETYHLDEFDGDNPLGQWLARSETGAISDPLDLDDGISVVKLASKYVSDVSESNKPPVYAYDVVRCAFHSYEKQEDFDGDRKAIEEDMIELRRQVAMRELRERLITQAKFEFPHGENLFYPPEKKRAPRAPKQSGVSKEAAEKKSKPKKQADPEKKVESEKKPGPEEKADSAKAAEPEKK